MALARAGRAGDAKSILTRILDMAPDQPDALQLLGLIARQSGDPDEAIRLFLRSLAANPRQPHVHNNLGNVLSDCGRVQEAIDHYRTAIAYRPDYGEAHFNLGLALARLDRHSEAIEAFEEAHALDPDNASILNALGTSERALKRHRKAVGTLEKAAACAPRSVKVLNNYGNALRDVGRSEEAVGVFHQASALAPEAAEPKLGLGGALGALGRFDEAEAVFEAILARDPENLEAHQSLKSLRFATGRADSATASFETGLERCPQNSLLWDCYVSALGELGRYEDALAALDSAERNCGAVPSLALARGRTLCEMGRGAEAIDVLDPLLLGDVVPKTAVLPYAARARLRLGDFDDCRTLLEDAIEDDPRDMHAWAYLGLVWRLLEDERAHWLIDYERHVRDIEVPVPAGHAGAESFNAALAESLTELHRTSAHPIDQSLRGGTQTLGALFRTPIPIVQELKDSISEAIAAYMADLPENRDHPFLRRKPSEVRFAGSWSCRLRAGGFHVDHIHPEGWLSSAYYVALPRSVREADGEAGCIRFGASPVPLPDPLEPARIIRPRVGHLALFPSFTWHGTYPFEDAEPRMTVAFDVEFGRG